MHANARLTVHARTTLVERIGAYARIHTSNNQRRRAVDRWLHLYNHHRGHTALGGRPPITATDAARQHT